MNCKELQIDDWVEYNGLNQKVKEISGLDNEVYLTMDECVDCTKVNPIPITQEILEKNEIELLEVGDNGVATPAKYRNRYEKWLIHTKWKDTYLWYDRTTKRWNLYDMNGAQFTYVHEFQHALRLCGIEKDIKI